MHHCPHQENRCCLSKLCGSQLLDAQESQSCQVCESGKASSLTHGLGTFQSLQPWSLAQDNAFRLQMKESVTVQEGLCILVPCSVFYPRRGWIDSDPAQGYWFRNESNILSDAPVATNDAGRKVQEETKGRFHLVGDPRDYNCSLDIRDARMADKGSYFFRIVRGSYVLYNFKQNQLYMHVTALTQTPNIHIQGTLESGHPTSITCKVPWACKRGMPPTFFWIGVAVTSLGSKTSNSSELTFTPEPHHHGTNLTCRVNFPGAGVATESTIQLNVSRSLAQDNAFRLQMNKSVTVQEGLCILVPCSVFYPRRGWIDSDPARGYWFRNESNYFSDAPVATNDAGRKVREETKGRFHLVGDPRDYNCSLDIRDARMADKGSYFFRIVRGSYVLYNFNHYQLYVHVTALTQTPNIHIQGTLESGHPTNITCKVPWACKRGMPPTFFWIGVAVTSLGSKTPNSSELTFTPEPHHHGTNLTCRVTFPGAGVATESTIQLNVSCATELNLTHRDPMRQSRTAPQGFQAVIFTGADHQVFLPWSCWDQLRSHWKSSQILLPLGQCLVTAII
ncbi:sialic acid-binding Ig-like lectin 12 isoform X4 [Loxodonta africana]|uniref:sialic acid-binding Ig-like lectin 12 isoform X4 n=1 Tax=Loxodonta africana TaxID=9785 RepID=UPI0030D11679